MSSNLKLSRLIKIFSEVLRSLPQGNGQSIYIDANFMEFDPKHIEEHQGRAIFDTEFIKLLESDRKTFATIERMVFTALFYKGYKICVDPCKTTEDTYFFSPCINSQEEYKDIDLQIRQCLKEEDIEDPTTIVFPLDRFSSNLPPLPLMLKNVNEHGGAEKYLIYSPEQLEMLKRFYREIDEYDYAMRYKECYKYYGDDGLHFKNGQLLPGISIITCDYRRRFHEDMVFQEYIETPTSYNTSLRVLFSSTGDILAVSLKYAKTASNNEANNDSGIFDRYLANPSSPYFINSEKIISNTVAGGSSILFGMPYYTKEERYILQAHGIDPNAPKLPDEILNACQRLASNFSKGLGAICGMDFILDDKTKKWKHLEYHQYPMLTSYCKSHGYKYDGKSETHNRLYDLLVRLEVLNAAMHKKKDTQKNI